MTQIRSAGTPKMSQVMLGVLDADQDMTLGQVDHTCLGPGEVDHTSYRPGQVDEYDIEKSERRTFLSSRF